MAAGPGLVERAERRENRRSRAHNNGWLVAGRYIGDYGRCWLARAVVARTALGANTRPETVPLALTDSQGRPLSGRHRYTLRFPRGQLPPVGAFWSLTMYNDDRFLVENHRPLCGRRSRPGLRRGKDGSLTVHIGRQPPRGAAARATGCPRPGPVPPRDAPLRAQAERSERALAPPATAPSLTDVSPAAALGTLDVRPVSVAGRERPSRSSIASLSDSRATQAMACSSRAAASPTPRPWSGTISPRCRTSPPRSARRPAHHGLRLPDPLRVPRHPHARRPPQRLVAMNPPRSSPTWARSRRAAR